MNAMGRRNVAWKDLVKGTIEFANTELDDLVIARGDGTPTYNFCVVVDDWDMRHFTTARTFPAAQPVERA